MIPKVMTSYVLLEMKSIYKDPKSVMDSTVSELADIEKSLETLAAEASDAKVAKILQDGRGGWVSMSKLLAKPAEKKGS